MPGGANDKRYVRETPLEARVAAIVTPVARSMGYHLVRIKILPENGCTLQIMAEDDSGRFSIADCEALSRDLSPVLDLEDPIDREYHLEVSSPGIDRPLVRARDFEKYLGHEARVELKDLIEGRKRFRGAIAAADDESVTIRLPDAQEGVDPLHRLALAQIAEAKLMMTTALLEAARKEQEIADPLDGNDVELIEDKEEETN